MAIHKTILTIVLIVESSIVLYVDLYLFFAENFLIPPIILLVHILIIVSTIFVALKKLFGVILALIPHGISQAWFTYMYLRYNILSFENVISIIFNIVVIVLAIIWISTKSSIVESKYIQQAYQQPTYERVSIRYCPNCGDPVIENVCTNYGQKLK